MNKEFEEILDICSQNEGDLPIAEAIYNAGYRKTVWHKVADGDLPKEDIEVCCFYRNGNYDVGKLITAWGKHKWDMNYYGVFVELNNVFAWTELPKYEGE